MPQDATALTFDTLSNAISGPAAAIRCRSKLQPAAGAGTKVFPPTHSGGVYATEQRRIPGKEQPVECVLLDSVQSQANRMEDALQDAVDRGLIELPLITVDFSEANASLDRPVNERITSLTVPHRLADAILRDCEVAPGQLFKDSDFAKAWGAATLTNATAVFAQCPTALFLGMWGSPERAGIGAKFARAIVSEVIGINAVYGIRTGSRIDPLDTRAQVQLINEGQGKWRVAKKGEKGTVNPSEVGHSNIPPSFSKYQKGAEGRDPLADQASKFTLQMKVAEGGNQVDLDAGTQNAPEARQGRIAAGGATISHAEHTAVLSLPQLRRLRFPIDGQFDPKRDDAARTVLAALALVGLTLAAERGFDLRSRCLLFPDDVLRFELLETPGKPIALLINSATAIAILKQAVEAAKKLKLPWNTRPIVLKPSPQLIELVKRSQAIATASEGSGE